MINNVLKRIKGILDYVLRPFGVTLVRVRPLSLKSYPESLPLAHPYYINIGAGKFYHPYWHKLDMPNDYYGNKTKDKLTIFCDLTKSLPLPINDDSVKVAYSSHVIEHLSDDSVQNLFNEVYRCLMTSGVFRITCPDIDIEYDAYMRGDESFWVWSNAYGKMNSSIEQKFLDHFATAISETHLGERSEKLSDENVKEVFDSYSKEDALNHFIKMIPNLDQKKYAAYHVNWFNFKKISVMLRNAGFSDIYESRYGQSSSPVLRDTSLFDSTCPALSVYVECRK